MLWVRNSPYDIQNYAQTALIKFLSYTMARSYNGRESTLLYFYIIMSAYNKTFITRPPHYYYFLAIYIATSFLFPSFWHLYFRRILFTSYLRMRTQIVQPLLSDL